MQVDRMRLGSFLMLASSAAAKLSGRELQATDPLLVDSFCGAGTFVDPSTNQCVCSSTSLPEEEAPTNITLSGIFDTTTYDWGPDVFEFTVKLINERRLWMNVLEPGHTLEYTLKNSNCDETEAVRAYWDLRSKNGNRPMHGIIGARCSGASIALARMSGVEGVPQVSAASNSATLSDPKEFPYFSRLVAPNNGQGEAGALVALMRHLNWERVAVLATNTQYAKDLTNEFKKLWVGEHLEGADHEDSWFGTVAYSDTIRIGGDGLVDRDSVRQAINGFPKDAPRVILLLGHVQHAYDILNEAHKSKLPTDTIWVGPSSWVGRKAQDGSVEVPAIPGYLGVAPLRNRDDQYQDFMTEFKAWLELHGKPALAELPTFATETVDAIVALAKAISSSPDWRDGDDIVRRLREVEFDGMSGRVHFTSEGDRKHVKYSILNAKESDGSVVTWTEVGVSGTSIGSTLLNHGVEDLCFASVGCGQSVAPSDSRPEPQIPLPAWIIVLVVVFALLAVCMAFKYRGAHNKKDKIKKQLDAFRKSVVGMRVVELNYGPRKATRQDQHGDVEQPLSGTIPVTPLEKVLWCWKESPQVMSSQDSKDVYGDRANCWVKYSEDCTKKLEEAYQGGKREFSPMPAYVVDFNTMEQTNKATKYKRAVQRVVEKATAKQQLDLGTIQLGMELPAEINGEPQMVLVVGDIVQISTQRQDGWAFGSKLHNADEAIARQLVCLADREEDTMDAKDTVNVSTNAGWFRLDATRVPMAEDLSVLQKKVGDAGALGAPAHWDTIRDLTVVQRHDIPEGDPEFDAVVTDFMSTLHPSTFGKSVTVLGVQRIQNLAMWQSYVVKRQTVCYRETGQSAGTVANTDDIQRRALQRFERKFLWHGSNVEVMDKIFQQGFNRSFCGKNATMYGKGVYFARDASYSAHRMYAVPDKFGRQYIMACRVVVGEYCRGQQDAITPKVRDAANQSLYDSTVDCESNPAIYVTYHDAQAYPEASIIF